MNYRNECLRTPRKPDTPLISVIVPVYNGEAYLSECVDSILSQTWPCMEIIIVDDGSTDGSGNIADCYCEKSDGKVRVIHQKNTGVSSARNAGIEAASGDWIGFVDGDDVIENDMYEILLKNALKSGAQISHCGYQIVVNNGERVHFFYNTGKVIEQSYEDGLRDLLSGQFIEPSLCNKMFSRSIINKWMAMQKCSFSVKHNEDLLLNYSLFKVAEKSVYEDICPYHYISRSKSATRSGFKIEKYLDPVRVWKWILEDVPEQLKTLAEQRYLGVCLYGYAELTKHPEYKRMCDKLKRELFDHKDKWHSLRWADRLRLRLLMVSPGLYHFCEKQYRRYFQKKVYV